MRDTNKHATLGAHFKAETHGRRFLHFEHTLWRLLFPVFSARQVLANTLKCERRVASACAYHFLSRWLPHHTAIISRLWRLFFPSTASVRGMLGEVEGWREESCPPRTLARPPRTTTRLALFAPARKLARPRARPPVPPARHTLRNDKGRAGTLHGTQCFLFLKN